MNEAETETLIRMLGRKSRKQKVASGDLVGLLIQRREENLAIEEFFKKQEELKKEEEKKKHPKGHQLTFAEGIILAYVFQLVFPPLWKAVTIHMGVQ